MRIVKGRCEVLITWEDIQRVNSEMETVPIKGKDYPLVKEKVVALRKLFPGAEVDTEIIHYSDADVCMKVTVKVDGVQLGCGVAEEKREGNFINETSFVENCETSALGRALASMGINSGNSYASADEIVNAELNQKKDFTPEEKRMGIKGLVNTIDTFDPDWWNSAKTTFGFEELSDVDVKLLDMIGKAARKRINDYKGE